MPGKISPQHSRSGNQHLYHMPNLPLYPESNGDTGGGTSAGSHDNSTPRWVQVFGIIAIVVVLLFVILHLTGGGPGRHTLP